MVTRTTLTAATIIISCAAILGCDAKQEEQPLPPQSNNPPITPPNQNPSLMFKGYTCTIDCSGHEAGYDWAEDHDINDPDDCTGNSESFIEGCRAYTEEQQGNTDEETEDEE